jgi:hypothetical protein
VQVNAFITRQDGNFQNKLLMLLITRTPQCWTRRSRLRGLLWLSKRGPIGDDQLLLKLVSVAATFLILVGCSSGIVSPHTLQFSGATLAYPENYQVEAARIVRDRRADPEFARLSEPQPTIGETAFSPKRWYVCIRGIPASTPKSTALPPLTEMVENLYSPETGVYDVLLIFSGRERPSVREGYDSPLCRDQKYQAITAEPPMS